MPRPTPRNSLGSIGSGASPPIWMCEEPAVPLHQLGGGGLGPLEHTLLMFARPGLDSLSRVQEGQADGPVPLAEREDPGVIVDGCRLERRVGFLRDLECGT